MRVLVVDDDAWTKQFVSKKIVEKYGHKVDTVETSLEGFKRIVSGNYDVALIDFNLGVMTGDQLIDAIKSEGLKTDIYIFTGYDKEYIKYKVTGIDNKALKGVINKDDMDEEFDRIFGDKNA